MSTNRTILISDAQMKLIASALKTVDHIKFNDAETEELDLLADMFDADNSDVDPTSLLDFVNDIS